MTAIMLTRIDNHRNMARFYKLDVEPTLFGECSLSGNGGASAVLARFASKRIGVEVRPTSLWPRTGRRSSRGAIARPRTN
jgi:predicted DNA-binding WGR domain protein